MMNRRFKIVVSWVLLLVICAGLVNVPQLKAEELNVESADGQVNTQIDTVSGNSIVVHEENVWDGITMDSCYEGENYKVTFTLSGYWQGGYNAGITIENTSNTVIENWFLKFSFQDSINNIWNAVIEENKDGVYIIKNADWNQDIQAHGNVSFGFSASNDFTGFPTKYEVLEQISEKQSEDYYVEYTLYSDWGDGFTGSINITNNTNGRLEDWILEFDFIRNIDSIWNAEIASKDDGHYVIRNSGYNANINAGQTISFGFTGRGGNSTDEPRGYKLYSYEKNAVNNSSELDSDGDGLTDELEIVLGLNPYSDDSDADGLTDYEEMNVTMTDPLKADTDGNGIIDSEDDMDGDGISNREEIDQGTDPLKSDTDGDNLTDYEEIHEYNTNPLLEDTDGDGLTDYEDVFLGFSPLLVDTDGNGIIDSEEKLYQTVTTKFEDVGNEGVTEVSVSLKVSGDAEKRIFIEDVYEIDKLSSGVVGLIGVPVDINCNTDFEQAEIIFHYDVNALGDTKEEDLAIMWYDEENNWYQILDEDSIVDTQDHTVSYTTTHFSTYMLADSKLWYNAWRENIDYTNSNAGDTSKNSFDIAFVVDVSISMGWDGRMDMAKKALNNFINSLQQDDDAAIVTFCAYASLASDFSNDKNKLKQIVNNLSVLSGTNVNSGLLKAIDTFEKHKCDKKNIVVLICDGDVNYVQSTINKCIADDIQIYAINVTSDSANILESMSSQTGGQYYYASTADELETIMVSIADNTVSDINTTDTDGDGLYDIFETAGMRMPNGQVVYTDPSLKDTDGDGLSDFQETGIIYNIDNRYIGNNMYSFAKYFQLRSYPTLKDSDGDGLTDDVDDTPMSNDFGLVAELDNKLWKSDYIHIKSKDGTIYHGGDQSWWKDKSSYQKTDKSGKHQKQLKNDEYYRLWQLGCGTIAMSDAELYMTFQNDGYSSSYPINFNEKNKVYDVDDYRDYLEQMYENIYTIDDNTLQCRTGLLPEVMEDGFKKFLKRNNNDRTNVKWARHVRDAKNLHKKNVLNDIKYMLLNNIPVVFSYFDLYDKDITLYTYIEDAKINKKVDEGINSHYMTVIGLYRFADSDTMDYKYILKVVSWGNIYYIDYNEYADKLSYFSNILSV
ncbi:MAG: cellulose binding domain-containing protein [Lachnospiraceae bacterium]|nr:cellulose binding domain-containing protein [Lachnospiraceae bacterium]